MIFRSTLVTSLFITPLQRFETYCLSISRLKLKKKFKHTVYSLTDWFFSMNSLFLLSSISAVLSKFTFMSYNFKFHFISFHFILFHFCYFILCHVTQFHYFLALTSVIAFLSFRSIPSISLILTCSYVIYLLDALNNWIH